MLFLRNIWWQPHIFSFLGGRFQNFNRTKFVLSPLSLPPRPCDSHYSFWLLDFTTSHCNLIALPFAYSIFTPISKVNASYFYCCVDPATTPPPISSRQLVRLSLYHRRSTREESKRLFSPPLLIDGHRWQPRLIPPWHSATFPNPQFVVGNQPKRQSAR